MGGTVLCDCSGGRSPPAWLRRRAAPRAPGTISLAAMGSCPTATHVAPARAGAFVAGEEQADSPGTSGGGRYRRHRLGQAIGQAVRARGPGRADPARWAGPGRSQRILPSRGSLALPRTLPSRGSPPDGWCQCGVVRRTTPNIIRSVPHPSPRPTAVTPCLAPSTNTPRGTAPARAL
jgi:hypothetical protein